VGSLVMKTEQNDYMRPTMALMDQLDSPYSELNAEEIRDKLPVWNTQSFFPVKRPDDPQFGRSAAGDAQHHARGATGRWRVYL
jgi:sarcosine oxidase subunit beta